MKHGLAKQLAVARHNAAAEQGKRPLKSKRQRRPTVTATPAPTPTANAGKQAATANNTNSDDANDSDSEEDEKTVKFHSLPGAHSGGARAERKCVIVSRTGEGDYSSIQTAIDSVDDNTLIMIEPGEYCESLTMNHSKEVVLAGAGKFSAVCIVAQDSVDQPEAGACLTVQRGTILVNNITFRHESASGVAAVLITNGVAKLKACEISSRNHIGLRVTGKAASCQLSASSLRHCFRSGIDVQKVWLSVYVMCVGFLFYIYQSLLFCLCDFFFF